MTVTKEELEEIKSMYEVNPTEVKKILDGQLRHLKKNIRILNRELGDIKPTLDQIEKEHLSLTKKRNKLIVKQLDGSPLTIREKEMLQYINEEIADLQDYKRKERPRFQKLKIDLNVHQELGKKVIRLANATFAKRKVK